MKPFSLLLSLFLSSLFACSAMAQSAPMDAYAKTLKTHVNDKGLVNYAALKAAPAELDTFIAWVGSTTAETYKGWKAPEQIAFWINAYNAYTLKLLADRHPITDGKRINSSEPHNSIMQIDGAWKVFRFKVLGEELTLDEMEHKRLRRDFKEPRIHMALVCGAVSCPYLRNEPFKGATLETQLADQSRRFLALPSNLTITKKTFSKTVSISRIFEWFGDDFPDLNAFLGTYAPEKDREFLTKGRYKTDYLPYDWSLNEQ